MATVAHALPTVNPLPPSPRPHEVCGSGSFKPGRSSEVGRGIFALFERAISRRLRFSKIRLMTADGQVVVLRRAGDRSRYTGQVQILDEAPYPENVYFGRINLEGVLCPGRDMTLPVSELLERLAADPEKVAFEYGKLTGRCCFCNLPLTDARSTAHGYGRTCSKHYGLPWDADRKLGGFVSHERDGEPVVKKVYLT